MAAREKSIATGSADDQATPPVPVFPSTRPEDVFGSLPNRGKPKTLKDMEKGILAEARRRHTRD
ncbi:hypothetical protein [Mesorhizobium neociceri]|uniref:Uncharacterized protein n=1 Tax=Mesorhizobium neociceri TaxID=1307853 RepID=A0A838B5S6_9HYPH|nr:hypothetical protein [Mesorhizobium neociceri]